MRCDVELPEYIATQQSQWSPLQTLSRRAGFDPENDIMAYVRTADGQYDFFATPKRKHWSGLFSRLLDSMLEGRQRAAEREIAAYLESGGKFLTDEHEREIERILSSSTRI
jgi:hypothetical protein